MQYVLRILLYLGASVVLVVAADALEPVWRRLTVWLRQRVLLLWIITPVAMTVAWQMAPVDSAPALGVLLLLFIGPPVLAILAAIASRDPEPLPRSRRGTAY